MTIEEAVSEAIAGLGDLASWASLDPKRMLLTVIGDATSSLRQSGYRSTALALEQDITVEVIRVLGDLVLAARSR